MVNINTHLPPTVAAAFHPPTESLQHDNLIRPVIPQTALISSYARIRDNEERTQFSAQTRSIIQDESQQDEEESSQQESSLEQRRALFFARRRELCVPEPENSNAQLAAIKDFKQVISVIQARYKSAVIPLPEPTVSYAI